MICVGLILGERFEKRNELLYFCDTNDSLSGFRFHTMSIFKVTERSLYDRVSVLMDRLWVFRKKHLCVCIRGRVHDYAAISGYFCTVSLSSPPK